jgi:hypothetical protein
MIIMIIFWNEPFPARKILNPVVEKPVALPLPSEK